jgi:formylglycine-generating enzyme required for sulfatase activity
MDAERNRCDARRDPMSNWPYTTARFVLFFLCLSFNDRSSQAVTIETVRVGNPGEGGVAFRFAMGKTEVTNSQYVEFLNAVAAADPHGLYHPLMSSKTWGGIDRSGESGSYSYAVKSAALEGTYQYDRKPVVYVSWFDVLRFANWLHNGQPTGQQNAGTTEDGAYTFSGTTSVGPRNPGALWFLPSDEEWVKAGYYDSVWHRFYAWPIGQGDVDCHDPAQQTGGSANCDPNAENSYLAGNRAYPHTDAGAYTQSASPYGTFDQGGNVFEWNERTVEWTDEFNVVHSERVLRGGSFSSSFEDLYRGFWLSGEPAWSSEQYGFRVARIPEPSTVLGLAWGLATAAMGWRKRGARKRGPLHGVDTGGVLELAV